MVSVLTGSDQGVLGDESRKKYDPGKLLYVKHPVQCIVCQNFVWMNKWIRSLAFILRMLHMYRRICIWEKSPKGECDGWNGGAKMKGTETRQDIPAVILIRWYEPRIKGELTNWSRAISEVKWHSLWNNWIWRGKRELKHENVFHICSLDNWIAFGALHIDRESERKAGLVST